MVSKNFRLPRRDFLQTKTQGKKHTAHHFSAVVYFPSSPLSHSHSRFSVVTSAKLAPKAVVRNCLRRQIYDQLSIFNYHFSINMILYPKPSMLNLSREAIRLELNSFLSKLHP